MDKKNILFISLYPTQSQYFNQLGIALQSEYNVSHLPCKDLLGFKEVFSNVELPQNIQPTEPEVNDIIYFYRQLTIYKKLSIRRKMLMSSYILKKQVYLSIYNFYHYFTQHKVDMVCVWNGNRPTLASAVYVAKKLNIKTMFFENGLLPNTTTVDSRGVNFKNSLTGLNTDFFSEINIDEAKFDQFRQQNSLVARQKRESKSQKILGRISKVNTQELHLPEKFIFLPFQVHDDTQILLFSPNITTMPQLLETVWRAVDEYNRKKTDDLWIVVKEHPSDFGRVNYRKLREKYPKIMFVNDYSTEELIKKSQGIITINSSVGIEALLYHKPVITLGDAFYNIPGIVTQVPDHYELSEYIDVVNRPVDNQLIDKFLFYLRYHYLADGTWRNVDDNHFASVMGKINDAFQN